MTYLNCSICRSCTEPLIAWFYSSASHPTSVTTDDLINTRDIVVNRLILKSFPRHHHYSSLSQIIVWAQTLHEPFLFEFTTLKMQQSRPQLSTQENETECALMSIVYFFITLVKNARDPFER